MLTCASFVRLLRSLSRTPTYAMSSKAPEKEESNVSGTTGEDLELVQSQVRPFRIATTALRACVWLALDVVDERATVRKPLDGCADEVVAGRPVNEDPPAGAVDTRHDEREPAAGLLDSSGHLPVRRKR